MIVSEGGFWILVTVISLGGMSVLALLLFGLTRIPLLGEYFDLEEDIDNQILKFIFLPIRLILNLSIFALPTYLVYLLFTQAIAVSIVTSTNNKLELQKMHGYASHNVIGLIGLINKTGLTSKHDSGLEQMNVQQFDQLIGQVTGIDEALNPNILINHTGNELYHTRTYFVSNMMAKILEEVAHIDRTSVEPGSLKEQAIKKADFYNATTEANNVVINNGKYFIFESPHQTYIGCSDIPPDNYSFTHSERIANIDINKYLTSLTNVHPEKCSEG